MIRTGFTQWLQKRRVERTPADTELPLRAELYGAEQLEAHAEALARNHVVERRRTQDRLIARLQDNAAALAAGHALLAGKLDEQRSVTPAGEWLLDNYHLIEQQIRVARRNLPKNYSAKLPWLANGPGRGLPRVYDLALAVIAHGDGRVDIDALGRVVMAYQRVDPLTLGELWAVPIMLQLALIENLRRVTDRLVASRRDRELALRWAVRMLEVAEREPKGLILLVADMARSEPRLSSAFVAEFARNLQGHRSGGTLPLSWLAQALAESGHTIEQLVEQESRLQAADQVSIGNSILTLGALSALDWREFVESVSVVEAVLAADPHGSYRRMDFASRDHYRHVVEYLADHAGGDEPAVARAALALAQDEAARHGLMARTAHIGYWLVDRGRRRLEARLPLRLSPWLRLRQELARWPLTMYLGTATVTALLATGAYASGLDAEGAAPGLLGLALALAFIASSELGVTLANWLATLTVRPKPVPRLDYRHGIPPEARTLVAVPVLLGSAADIDTLVDALEVRYLANRDPQLGFVLLSDLPDAATETTPDDAARIERARAGIARLNACYGRADDGNDRGSPFALLHRPRTWNAAEGVWMGRERKRGKLADLNALLLEGRTGAFSHIEGDLVALAGSVRFVITLDADTQLPRDAAAAMVGALAHPLNRARFDEDSGRVVEGYGILQPRVDVMPSSVHRSAYARLHGGEAGIDPYSQLASDVYQDVFGEGSFIGKGIYDVAAFEAAGRSFPDNRILSHDLLEGCYARAGLLSDTQLYEDMPARHLVDARRRERWIRGDWQIGGWLLARVPGADGRRRNPLSALSRWKIADNLRRSLVPAATVALLLLGAGVLGAFSGTLLLAIAVLLTRPVCEALLAIVRKPPEAAPLIHLRQVGAALWRQTLLTLCRLAWLPHEAAYSLDAIGRTLWRLTFSHRRLLQWTTSSDAERSTRADLAGACRQMAAGPLAAALLAAVAIPAGTLPVVLPLMLMWLAGPWLAWQSGKDRSAPAPQFTAAQQALLGATSRRIWAFFETFVGPQEHWLPPDNFQEQPVPALAHRTSPTNIGLALLASLSARDFGYLDTQTLIERVGGTLATLERLERLHGHFYNWYDTQSLQPLPPRYVSTVDSGNLAGHLLVLRAGLLGLAQQPFLPPRLGSGLAETLLPIAPLLAPQPRAALEALAAQLPALALPEAVGRLREWLALPPADGEAELLRWRALLTRQLDRIDAELVALAGADGSRTLVALAAGDGPVAALARTRLQQLEALAERCGRFAGAMDFRFLYDPARRLLTIGFNQSTMHRDTSYYDLLASEARLTSFVAIALGQLPQESWFSLGRRLTAIGGEAALVSWSGSMFEYLMPPLVMPEYRGTLLERTCAAAVARQIAYGRQRNVPWGISESGYNATDAQFNYQYRAFGVPGLGLKRGLGDDLVIAPYATLMALPVDPPAAVRNLQRMAEAGFLGRHGFYEAIDYTPHRLPPNVTHAVVRSFMAHHQGMAFLALAQTRLGPLMQQRFAADKALCATLLLLQERVPASAAYRSSEEAVGSGPKPAAAGTLPERPNRSFDTADTALPQLVVLSNGSLNVLLTQAGGSRLERRGLALTRWREDGTCDDRGLFFYLRDTASGAVWSAGFQPVRVRPPVFSATFSEGRAEFLRRDGDIELRMEVVVSPEDDIELRRLHLTNRGTSVRSIELTSFAEVALAPPAADAAHPAFSKLFVQTEAVPEAHALLATRRARGHGEAQPWLLHALLPRPEDPNTALAPASFETDRARFIGRTRSSGAPLALAGAPGPLSGTTGAVLDPVIAIRHVFTIRPGESMIVDALTGGADSREAAQTLLQKYRDPHMADRVFDLAWIHSQVVLRQLGVTETDAQLYWELAACVVFSDAHGRADAATLRQNRRGQSGLWSHAISGDLPIVLLRIQDVSNLDLARQLIQAHAYWRSKGLVADLVILNEDHASYRPLLLEQITGLIAAGIEASSTDKPGGIYVRNAEHVSHEDRVLLESVARFIAWDRKGTLEQQLRRSATQPLLPPVLAPAADAVAPAAPVSLVREDLLLDNGFGGYTADGREYLIRLRPDAPTPLPWANVIANAEGFGTVISECGSAYTWAVNAHEYRLTPWHNDPVSDSCGEAFYVRDEDSGRYWSPTPLPARGRGDYLCRHGFGYSVFEHIEDGIVSELAVWVGAGLPVKFSRVMLRNDSGRPRRLSLTGYVEWVLGEHRWKSAPHVITECDAICGALLAHNAYSSEFPHMSAFFDADPGPQPGARSYTTDRTEFIGRNGSLAAPAAMGRTTLGNRTGAGLDPCAAIRLPLTLAPGEQVELVFRLGAAPTHEVAQRAVAMRTPGVAWREWRAMQLHWEALLDTVQIDTPDPAVNLLGNGWLVYQVLGCRMQARSGYYQSGGAFGLRDQLQDAMALVHAAPQRLRAQLLLAASRQFIEGDGQHWWHPPGGRGVRTRCSDDYLWLPLATCRYVGATGDTGVLDEVLPFLEGRPVPDGEESYYDLPSDSQQAASLYEHCRRAIRTGLRYGGHGLPLMLAGDWNDGMNLVGIDGRGESVWLGFFLYTVLQDFAPLAARHGDDEFATLCRREAATLRDNLERHAWDGEWYLRAWFDDGSPLGSQASAECRIDAIAQSWAVLSGAADPARSAQAMDSLERRLVRREAGIIQLFDPPFSGHGPLDPGYIRGYLPGVRENGGQYTHSAVWSVMAFAALGERQRAWELFDLINPLNRTRDAAGIERYRAEPYVMAADVYGVEPHTGRGGWTWYTGSAGWMYRLLLESLLGLTRHADALRLDPLLPDGWPGYTLTYRHGASRWRIEVSRGRGGEGAQLSVDGRVRSDGRIPLVDDGAEHRVELKLDGRQRQAA